MPEENIFCERQRGDFCRMHSINNYIGESRLNEEEFYKYCDEYDSIITGLKSRNMDGFAEGRSIVSYIMDILVNKFTEMGIRIKDNKTVRVLFNVKGLSKSK